MADNTISDEAPSLHSSPQAVSGDTDALSNSGFSKIPSEIRNEIYELAFTPDSDDATVDLLSAKPPSKALLLTCKQVHAESRGIYKSAYRHFWTNSKFVARGIDRRKDKVKLAKFRSIKDRDLDQIQSISLEPLFGGGNAYDFVHPRGVWTVTHYGRSHSWLVALQDYPMHCEFRGFTTEADMDRSLDKGAPDVALSSQIREIL